MLIILMSKKTVRTCTLNTCYNYNTHIHVSPSMLAVTITHLTLSPPSHASHCHHHHTASLCHHPHTPHSVTTLTQPHSVTTITHLTLSPPSHSLRCCWEWWRWEGRGPEDQHPQECAQGAWPGCEWAWSTNHLPGAPQHSLQGSQVTNQVADATELLISHTITYSC